MMDDAALDALNTKTDQQLRTLADDLLCGLLDTIRALREQVKEANLARDAAIDRWTNTRNGQLARIALARAEEEQNRANTEKARADALAMALVSAREDLVECYKLTGADPDDNSDAVLAPYAVDEVQRFRREHDALATEHARLRAALEIIVECKARFSLDPLEHARTAVQYCRDHARAALLAASQEEK